MKYAPVRVSLLQNRLCHCCIGSAVGMEIVSGWMYAVSIYICPLGAMLAAIMFFCAFFISFAIIITDIFNKKYKKKCYMTAKENINEH